MSLMYDVNTLNAAMIRAAEVCRQDMPEGDKVNAVLACFAGMKPVEAEPVVHARWVPVYGNAYMRILLGCTCYRCSACGRIEEENSEPYCHCGARMDAKEDAPCG